MRGHLIPPFASVFCDDIFCVDWKTFVGVDGHTE